MAEAWNDPEERPIQRRRMEQRPYDEGSDREWTSERRGPSMDRDSEARGAAFYDDEREWDRDLWHGDERELRRRREEERRRRERGDWRAEPRARDIPARYGYGASGRGPDRPYPRGGGSGESPSPFEGGRWSSYEAQAGREAERGRYAVSQRGAFGTQRAGMPRAMQRDLPSRGRYSGKGPQSYRKSDARIMEQVCEALTEAPDIDASGMEVKVQEGEVILSGTADSRRSKRRAEEVAERVVGVKDVLNQIRIKPAAASPGSGRYGH